VTRKIIYIYFEHNQDAPHDDPLLNFFSQDDILCIAVSDTDDFSSTCNRVLAACKEDGKDVLSLIVIINLYIGGAKIPSPLLSKQSKVKDTLLAVSNLILNDTADRKKCQMTKDNTQLRSHILFRYLRKALDGKAVFAFTTDEIELNPRSRSIIYARFYWEGVTLMYSWHASHDYYERNAYYLSAIASKLGG